jgi:hydroxyacylglutathione hydrolase
MSDTEAHCCSVAIVGGGCSGVLTAVQLFRQGHMGRIVVIEPRARLGVGLAYSTGFDQHLLNVPAARMSAIPEEPAHFLEWLRRRHSLDAAASCFVPRRLYGDYLSELLESTVSRSPPYWFGHIRAEAMNYRPEPDGMLIETSTGMSVRAGKVVLALGNPASSEQSVSMRYGLEMCWHVSPWFDDALGVRFPGERPA